MKKFCIALREHAADVINFENKKMLPLTKKKELKSHQDLTVYYTCRKNFTQRLAEDKNHQKVREHFHFTCKYIGQAETICNLRFIVPNGIPTVFHNGSNYDYDFIMKELANKFKGQFECFEENTDTYKTFSVSIEKEIRKVDKDGNEDSRTVTYKMKSIDSARFMASSL